MKTLVKTTKAQFVEVLGNVAVAFKLKLKNKAYLLLNFSNKTVK